MLYLDTSALLKLYVREAGSEFVDQLVCGQDEPLPIWEIQEMEFLNALRLKVFWKDLELAEADALSKHFQQRKARGLYYMPELSRPAVLENFRELSLRTPELGCRTMDILHVACAICLNADHFVTFDRRQAELAQERGLRGPELS